MDIGGNLGSSLEAFQELIDAQVTFAQTVAQRLKEHEAELAALERRIVRLEERDT